VIVVDTESDLTLTALMNSYPGNPSAFG